MKLHVLGPEGSFSHAAAMALQERLGATLELSMAATAEAVVRAVAEPGAEHRTLGIVPYYNFLEGLVQEHLDLIYELGVRVVGLIRIPIELAAGGFADPAAGRCEVLSHPKALAQASDFLRSRFASALVTPVDSTASAAKQVSERRRGIAIASEAALRQFNLPIVARDVGNVRHGQANFTDFFVVAPRSGASIDLGAPTHTLIAITPRINRLGLLCEMLEQFRFYELDIAKIHSRPAIDAVDVSEEPQMFYLEVRSAPDADPLLRCAEAIQFKYGTARSPGMLTILGAFCA